MWVTNRFDGTVSRIDPDRGEVVETIPVGLDPRGIAVGFGSVWVGLAGSNTVVRIDPETNEVTQPIGVGNAPGSLAVSADAVWVVNTLDDTVSQISPDTNSVVDTIGVGDGPSGIAVVDGTVWVANEADGTLSRIEPGQSSARSDGDRERPAGARGRGRRPVGLRPRDGDLASRRNAADWSRSCQPDSLDPAVAYDSDSWRLLHLLGDGLVAFEPIGGTNAQLVPDLATSIPTPTDGGRTYTFELRPGIRYSNGEVVAPSRLPPRPRTGFPLHERLRVPLRRARRGRGLRDEPRTCDLSKGIVTDDASRTITFHLSPPTPSSSTSSRCRSPTRFRPPSRTKSSRGRASRARARTCWRRR